jgi:hypothetical protein
MSNVALNACRLMPGSAIFNRYSRDGSSSRGNLPKPPVCTIDGWTMMIK